jgi:hypothetical protein
MVPFHHALAGTEVYAMRTIAFLCCLCMLAGAAALIYAAWNMEQATFAMIQMANDNRDIFPRLAEAEQRINIERGQLAKDGIRIRSLLNRLEGKTNGAGKEKPGGSGGAERDQGGTDRKAPPVSKGKH